MAGITLQWDNDEQTCYRFELGFGWTWTQFVEEIDKAHMMIAEKEHDVNLIMWFTAKIPPGNPAEPFQHAGGTQPPNLRHTVMVNESTRFLDILIRNTDKKHGWVGPKIVRTLEEARAYLQTLD
jgi:hypothetical protein